MTNALDQVFQKRMDRTPCIFIWWTIVTRFLCIEESMICWNDLLECSKDGPILAQVEDLRKSAAASAAGKEVSCE